MFLLFRKKTRAKKWTHTSLSIFWKKKQQTELFRGSWNDFVYLLSGYSSFFYKKWLLHFLSFPFSLWLYIYACLLMAVFLVLKKFKRWRKIGNLTSSTILYLGIWACFPNITTFSVDTSCDCDIRLLVCRMTKSSILPYYKDEIKKCVQNYYSRYWRRESRFTFPDSWRTARFLWQITRTYKSNILGSLEANPKNTKTQKETWLNMRSL